MDRVLFMTVGTGVGDSEDKIDSLAHGLLKSINHSRPDKIIFFGSELSKKTVEYIEKQSNESGKRELTNYEFVLIGDVDEFKDCFGKIQGKVLEYIDHEIIIDYTSGTKTMTTSAAICSLLYHRDLTVVYGDREQNGMVGKGTEQVKTQNLYLAYDKLLFEDFKKFFNNYRFQTAAETMEKIVSNPYKEGYLKLARAYHAWDLFNHEICMELITSPEVTSIIELKGPISRNMSVLGPLANPQQRDKNAQLIADLLNNAQRRGAEQKYDDAVARLYRTTELIAQCALQEKLGIDTSDVDQDKLSPLAQNQMKWDANRDGKITVGLHKSYEILRYENEEIGKIFSSDKKLKDLLKQRNQSILAHGLKPISEEEYRELLEKTKQLAIEAYPSVEKLMENAEFPKL